MEILFVSATPIESEGVRNAAQIHDNLGQGLCQSPDGRFGSLVTGIGMVNTALTLGKSLQSIKPDWVFNLGIAGAFAGGPEIAEVVEISEDCYGDMGAESPQGFIGLEEMGFVNFSISGNDYFNRIQNPHNSDLELRKCKGITVNRVHGIAETIAEIERIWQPEVETMEVAAVFQCCLMANVPFTCLRGISNRVEPRNRENWRIREAVDAVEAVVIQHILKPRL